MTHQPYTDARDLLVRRAAKTPAPNVEPGSTSYFSRPTSDLDPRLFVHGTDRLQPTVRDWILRTLYVFWNDRYQRAHDWSTVWIAGSGITHQWSAGRGGIGDLDVLIGVDFTDFRIANPRYAGVGEKEIVDIINDQFKTVLDPHTANWNGFEVTFYVNPGATDIRDINPYAAYNVTTDKWTVHPITIPSNWNPEQFFPKEWWTAIHEETANAKEMLAKYRSLRSQLRSTRDVARRRNLATELYVVVRDLATLFNDIHLSRRNAFSHDGKGYLDWYNFRWQAHKRDGVVPALHVFATLLAELEKEVDVARYGVVLTDSQAALTASSLAHDVADRLEVRR